jgi:hypothetical protein
VDSERDLRNQSVIQESCWRDLSWAPFRVKDNDWIATVNKAMDGIKGREIPVPKGTDTTEMGELRDLFIQFLIRRRTQNGQPCMVQVGQVYRAEGIHYFTTPSIMAFLRSERFSLGKVNLREQLIAYGCLEARLTYKTAKGEEKEVPCWQKPDDTEIREMDAAYEDVYDTSAEILQNIKPKKQQDEGGNDDESVKF